MMASATKSPSSAPAAEPGVRTTLRACNVIVPPSGIASRALTAILTSASSSSPRQTSTGQILSSMSTTSSILPRSEGASMSRTAPMCACRSTMTGMSCCRRENVSNCRVSFSPRPAGGRPDRFDGLDVLPLAQLALQDLRIAGDDHKQIVEIMCDASGELTEGFHLLRLSQLLSGLVERNLCLTLGSDIAGYLGKPGQFTCVVANGFDQLVGIKVATVLTHEPAF